MARHYKYRIDASGTLQAQRAAWDRRPLLRLLYRDWFRRIERELSAMPGPTVELGAGIGAFKEFRPETVSTDALPSAWADAVVDAEELPYDDGSVANLVMVDVFHHLPRPGRFLSEAGRALAPGGRVVMVEPYCSPVSTPLYRRFHQERTDLSADPFGGDALSSDEPFEGNQALPTLVFWRGLERYRAAHPELEVTHRERLALLAYPLSGGFTRRPLVPPRVGRALLAAERGLAFAAPLMAFRCLVTLELRRK
jgi:SAM-dependent methyltransferase